MHGQNHIKSWVYLQKVEIVFPRLYARCVSAIRRSQKTSSEIYFQGT